MEYTTIYTLNKQYFALNRRFTIVKYTKQEKLDIGRRIYNDEITRYQAAELYNICEDTARNCMRMYRDANNLPPKNSNHRRCNPICTHSHTPSLSASMEDYQSMSKEELIRELLKARIAEARLKKGYAVKGDGTVILYGNKNTK